MSARNGEPSYQSGISGRHIFVPVVHGCAAFRRSSVVESAVDGLIGSTIVVLITMTCAYDAAVLGRPWALGARFPFLIFWPAALPAYVVCSRGWWGCVVMLIHAAVLSVMACVFGIATVLLQGVGR